MLCPRGTQIIELLYYYLFTWIFSICIIICIVTEKVGQRTMDKRTNRGILGINSEDLADGIIFAPSRTQTRTRGLKGPS